MPEIQKYNLREQLHIADDKYKGSTSLVGMSSLTQAPYINSTRTQMFTSHLKQFLNLINPEFPYVFSNAENTVGKYSSGYKRAKTNLKIVKKIAKYDDILEKPFIYHLFVYNRIKACIHPTSLHGTEYLLPLVHSVHMKGQVHRYLVQGRCNRIPTANMDYRHDPAW